jgi:hypothetical protein
MVFITSWPVYSQEYASAAVSFQKDTEKTEKGSGAERRSLNELLRLLSSTYQVSFNYDDDVVKDIVLEEKFVWNRDEKLEKVLKRLLSSVELKFEKLDQKNYLIYPLKKESMSRALMMDSGTTRNRNFRLVAPEPEKVIPMTERIQLLS